MQFAAAAPGAGASGPVSPVAAFFRSTNLVLAVFDTRRGQFEGEEHEKLLSFFPTIAPVNVRASIVGLAQGVAAFAATLAQEDSRYKTMVADCNKWVMYEAEPSIWMLAVFRKSWAGGSVTDAAFKALLASTHDVFVLLHGPLSTLLEQDPTGFAARRVLQPLLDETGSRLLRTDAAAAREAGGHGLLANPLAPHAPGAVPLVTTSHAACLAVQCLVNQALVASFYGTRLVSGALVLWAGLPVWSTLGPEDTAALAGLAARALSPAAKAAQRGRPGAGAAATAAAAALMGGGAPVETAFETLASPLQWRAGGGIAPPAPSLAASLGFSSGPAATAASAGLSSPPAAGLGLGGGGGAGGGGFGTPGGGAPAPAASQPFSGGAMLPVSSSAASGFSASASLAASAAAAAGGAAASNAGGAHAGGGAATPGSLAGVGSPLPPYLSSFLRPRLRPSLYSPGGAVLALAHDAMLPMAHVWLRGSSEWAQLLPYHRGPLLVLCLLHDGPPPAPEVLAALAAVLNRGSGPAAAALGAELPPRASGLWHEKGHRYCYTDPLCHASRYSPLKKVLTLSASAQRHLAHLRSKLDEWEGAAVHAAAQQQQRQRQAQAAAQAAAAGAATAQGSGGGGADGVAAAAAAPAGNGEQQSQQQQQQQQPSGLVGGAAPAPPPPSPLAPQPRPTPHSHAGAGEAELVVRTAHDAWLVLRAAPGGRRLYCVSEQAGPEPTLAAAVSPTDALCDRLFPGVFLAP